MSRSASLRAPCWPAVSRRKARPSSAPEPHICRVLTLLVAGHETTAKALTWSLYLLARAPAWQQRMRDEVRHVAGDAPIDAGHLEQLDVTERVLKEAMRLYPPAPVMARRPLRDIELGGHHIPADSQVVIPLFCVHRHRALWDDPDRFDPDRFTAARVATLPRTQYMPFGAGARTSAPRLRAIRKRRAHVHRHGVCHD